MTPGVTYAAKLAFLKGQIKADHVFRVALYDFRCRLTPASEKYTTDHEVKDVGYKAKGKVLATPSFGLDLSTAWMNFPEQVVWKGSSISARGALIFDETLDDLAIVVVDFGKTITSTNDDFKLTFPADGRNALITLPK